jgi:hypothetical protein
MNQGISMTDTLRDFVEKMNELGIEYMVTGSFAMSAYGEIRMTRDIDIVIGLKSDDVGRFIAKFGTSYYVGEQSIKRAIDRQSMFNIINNEHGGKIYCIILKDSDHARKSFEQRYKVSVNDIDFWVTTKEDLIIAKLNWARDSFSELQIRDIANLTMSEYNSAYVSDWIDKLGLNEIWAKVNEWKTLHSKTEK